MKLTFYGKRFKHNDDYELNKTVNGWHSKFMATLGDCDKRGEPKLFEALRNNSAVYPETLGDDLEKLWDISDGWTEAQIQAELDKIQIIL